MALYQLTEVELEAVTGGSRSRGGDRQVNKAIVVGANVIVDGNANTRGREASGGQYLSQSVSQSNET